jgi:ElaB/YqjD/DUF883 family membrane-anchored ribosome-binding protein
MPKSQDTEFDVQAEFEKMKSQVAELLESLKDKGESKAAELNAKLGPDLESYKQVALKKAQQVQDASHEGVEQVTGYVKANPMASLGIAFGVGFVIARLLSGKSN